MSTATMVQIRNVPAELHRRLKSRAALEGMSMSDFIMREMKKALDRPSRQEVLDRIRARRTPSLKIDVAKVIREGRDER